MRKVKSAAKHVADLPKRTNVIETVAEWPRFFRAMTHALMSTRTHDACLANFLAGVDETLKFPLHTRHLPDMITNAHA